MSALRRRRDENARRRRTAEKRQAERVGTTSMMSGALLDEIQNDWFWANWRGGPSVLAFLFAHPDSPAIIKLDQRGEYFNCRTGSTWDLFFPGYYASGKHGLESQIGAKPVGQNFAFSWYFNPQEFDAMRQYIEQMSEGKWRYSGGTDLVLIDVWISDTGDPTVYWESTVGGELSNVEEGLQTLGLPAVVERITRDFDDQAESTTYGVAEVVTPSSSPPVRPSMAQNVMTGALSGIIAALFKSATGLP
jgi:hypothetical protein